MAARRRIALGDHTEPAVEIDSGDGSVLMDCFIWSPGFTSYVTTRLCIPPARAREYALALLCHAMSAEDQERSSS